MKPFPLSKSKGLRDFGQDRYEGLLLQYKDLLKRYSQTLDRYMQNLTPAENRGQEGQMSTFQMSQLKDQGEKILFLLEEIKQRDVEMISEIDKNAQDYEKKILDQIESLMATNIETNYKLEEIDKNLVNNLTANFVELQTQLLYLIKENQTHLQESHQILHKKVRGNRVFLWIIFLFQFVGIGALAFIILYLLDYISF